MLTDEIDRASAAISFLLVVELDRLVGGLLLDDDVDEKYDEADGLDAWPFLLE